jgi:hypothetical protein
MNFGKTLAVWVLGAGLLAAVGCKSPHIQVTVENHTGAEVRLLEVDYPSASFGIDSIAAGGSMHYLIQVRDSGQVKVMYTDPHKKQVQVTGPTLAEGQRGALEIVLEPEGKAEFTRK